MAEMDRSEIFPLHVTLPHMLSRFPVVDRAITEMRVFRDDSTVKMNVNNSLMRVLLKSRGEPIPPGK